MVDFEQYEEWRGLSLHQPWASLCVPPGPKYIETRSRCFKYRGPLVIHSTKNTGAMQTTGLLPQEVQGWIEDQLVKLDLDAFANAPGMDPLTPYGCVLGVVMLTDCVTADDTARAAWEDQLPYGDFADGRGLFILTERRRLTTPIPFTGQRGLWLVPFALRQSILDDLRKQSET